MIRKAVPMITCSPVAMKKVDSYAESAIVNDASIYSYAYSAVK